jgi:hypothetical protein
MMLIIVVKRGAALSVFTAGWARKLRAIRLQVDTAVTGQTHLQKSYTQEDQLRTANGNQIITVALRPLCYPAWSIRNWLVIEDF